MYRFTQLIRNSYIRIEGLLYQIFGSLFGWLRQLFQFLSRLFGFDKSQYFLEDEAQANKLSETKSDTPGASPSVPQNSSASTVRRRPDANMDYFLKMTKKEKKSS